VGDVDALDAADGGVEPERFREGLGARLGVDVADLGLGLPAVASVFARSSRRSIALIWSRSVAAFSKSRLADASVISWFISRSIAVRLVPRNLVKRSMSRP
jgi:hypothetical protein